MNTSDTGNSAAMIEIHGLSRRYGAKWALTDIDLQVPRGIVFGLVGENGAGKTTLIKHLLGLLKPEKGRVQVMGLDPVRDRVAVLGRIGYLSEENDLPGWMRVDELLRFTRAFYPTWEPDYAEKLRRDFELDPAARIKNLSKGQRARAGLLVALAHRPGLMILDEPSSGLDPIVRRDILEAIIRTITDEGRTVLFSSHLLDEVERVADRVAMLQEGKIVWAGELDAIKESHHLLTLQFEAALTQAPNLAGVISCEGAGREWTAVCAAPMADLQAGVNELGARILNMRVPSLHEIFLARASTRRNPVRED